MTLEEAVAESGIIAILRGVRPDEVLAVAEALYSAGVRVIEVPLNSPDPYDSIGKLATEYQGRLLCGGGTVLTQAHVEKVCAAGGRLAVAPNTDPAVIRRAISLGMTPFPGFGGATEAFLAIETGAQFLKLFPASTYGVGHLKALKAVLPPEVVVAPVGGVGPGDIAEWRAAGAGCFGIGSELYKPGMAADEVHRRAVELVKAAA
ncbi:MAG: 2-dehydro-3-deoxy-6-phosphogalactonate aldolase [Caulobacteraceae bacterium]|nr:2-dehydro-3-deoxy-6-phosphogalactonate aldolase [Caulobacteraceae bacterium]